MGMLASSLYRDQIYWDYNTAQSVLRMYVHSDLQYFQNHFTPSYFNILHAGACTYICRRIYIGDHARPYFMQFHVDTKTIRVTDLWHVKVDTWNQIHFCRKTSS